MCSTSVITTSKIVHEFYILCRFLKGSMGTTQVIGRMQIDLLHMTYLFWNRRPLSGMDHNGCFLLIPVNLRYGDTDASGDYIDLFVTMIISVMFS